MGIFSALRWAHLNYNDDATVRACGRLQPRANEAIQAMKNDNILGFAASRKFGEVMTLFPDLKEKFMLAATRVSAADLIRNAQMQQNGKPAAGATAKGPGKEA